MERDLIYRHNYEAQYSRKIEKFCDKDKDLVKSFINQKRAEGIGLKRLVKLAYVLYSWRQFLPDKNWKDLTKDDFEDKLKQVLKK